MLRNISAIENGIHLVFQRDQILHVIANGVFKNRHGFQLDLPEDFFERLSGFKHLGIARAVDFKFVRHNISSLYFNYM